MSLNQTLLPLVMVVIFLAFTAFWMLRGYPRLEAAFMRRLGDRLGVRIGKRTTFRGAGSWEIYPVDSRTPSKGCWVTLNEFAFMMGCSAAPIFLMLIIITLIMFAANGGF